MTQNFLQILETRFQKNMHRHLKIKWDEVLRKLEANPKKLEVLQKMEETGGEPDLVDFGDNTTTFCDCSAESPTGRRSLCYDQAALDSRKEHKPKDSAIEMAKELGIELLTEAEYRTLQELGTFDLKTSSWIQTPTSIRKLGGALFCDRRYDQVFLYHNGAESYYAARGFRGSLKV